MENNNITLIIFGGTGDLTKRKLIPAITHLIKNNSIGKESVIIGIARGDLDDYSYKELLFNNVVNDDKKLLDKLNIKFYKGDARNSVSLSNLSKVIESSGANNRIFYLATSYSLFPSIVKELEKQKLNINDNKFTRIVFEKPFGRDLESFNEIDKVIHEVFLEEQIFRIDHYLAKETVQNISTMKFNNSIFDRLLCGEDIESIEFIIDENLGVGNRLEYYDDTGAIKDMMQNHMLQMVSLLLMYNPKEINTENIRNEKVKILKSIEIMPPENHLLGQYSSYKDEAFKKGIKDSKTVTFAKISLNCTNKRWNGTKLTLRTGKKLEKKYGQIKINFKSMNKSNSNQIVIDIYPKQDVKIIMNTRKPVNGEIIPVCFNFIHESYFGPNTIDEYSTLLNDVIKGEMTLFTRFDELQESWRIVEDFESIRDKVKFVIYDDFTEPEKKI